MHIFIRFLNNKFLFTNHLFFQRNCCFQYKIKTQLSILLIFYTFSSISQTEQKWIDNSLFFNTEILIGKTLEANVDFPKSKPQKQIIFNIGRDQSTNNKKWSQRLKGPKTGYSFGITDFGNIDSLGLAFSFMPFIKFKAFRSERIRILAGMGASYFTKKFDAVKNPLNQAVTTDITWAVRTYLYYEFLSTKHTNLQLGVGYSHHSNGHTRLHNKGYNSYLLSLSMDIKKPNHNSETVILEDIPILKKPKYNYFETRGGFGQNSFALAFNEKKIVYTFAGEYGRVYKNVLKVGVGFYCRFYEHYYNYIKNNEWMVKNGKEFDYFKSAPVYYSTNIGVSLNGEILMNHVAVNMQIGFNLHKPAYKMEWRVNKGWDNTPKEIPDGWVLGNFDGFYKVKELIAGRLGLKYYVLGTKKRPTNNIYIAAHINSNLGQADFSDISLGYLHSFNL